MHPATHSILISGTSSGIGRACVARFHAAGWQVLATVRKTEDAESLRNEFPGVTVLEVELTDEAQVRRVIGEALAVARGVDVLVNNAGRSIIGAAEEITLAEFRAQLDINLYAAIQLSQLVLPSMRANGRGRIVQVSSGFGRIALPMFSAYCASKYALEGFSEALAHEVAPFGIGVSLVEPGAVSTKLAANRHEGSNVRLKGPYARLYSTMRARLAESLERRASSAEEVAAVIFSAATVRRPALRYTVGNMGFAAALAARLIPDRLKQVTVGRMTGDR